MRAEIRGLVDHLGGMQQRLGGDAADIEADAAEHRPAFDQHHLGAEIGGAEGGGVAAGTGAEHQHFGVEVALGRRMARLRAAGGGRRAAGVAALGCGAPSSSRITEPSPTLSPTLTFISATTPACGRGHFHRRLVGFEHDQAGLPA